MQLIPVLQLFSCSRFSLLSHASKKQDGTPFKEIIQNILLSSRVSTQLCIRVPLLLSQLSFHVYFWSPALLNPISRRKGGFSYACWFAGLLIRLACVVLYNGMIRAVSEIVPHHQGAAITATAGGCSHGRDGGGANREALQTLLQVAFASSIERLR